MKVIPFVRCPPPFPPLRRCSVVRPGFLPEGREPKRVGVKSIHSGKTQAHGRGTGDDDGIRPNRSRASTRGATERPPALPAGRHPADAGAGGRAREAGTEGQGVAPRDRRRDPVRRGRRRIARLGHADRGRGGRARNRTSAVGGGPYRRHSARCGRRGHVSRWTSQDAAVGSLAPTATIETAREDMGWIRREAERLRSTE